MKISKSTDLIRLSCSISSYNRDWLDRHAHSIKLSRSAYLDRILDVMRETESTMGKKDGLFDAYTTHMESLIDEAFKKHRR